MNEQILLELLTHLIVYAALFSFFMSVVRLLLPPKELVLKYWPNAKWYAFLIDVITRWGSLDLRTKVWDMDKHVKALAEKQAGGK